MWWSLLILGMCVRRATFCLDGKRTWTLETTAAPFSPSLHLEMMMDFLLWNEKKGSLFVIFGTSQ
jgi:hypothetical protein